MIIKVCGMRQPDNIRMVEALDIDWMGFIFYPKSPRFVASRPYYLPLGTKRVGVFVNATMDEILTHVSDYSLDLIQLHGHETPEVCRQVRTTLQQQGENVRLIKAISIHDEKDLLEAQRYDGVADYLLFDTKTPGYGGSGQKFDWSLLNTYPGTTPFLLSGGIDADDAATVGSITHPLLIGIDLNSRFETAPALKDIGLLKAFITTIRSSSPNTSRP